MMLHDNVLCIAFLLLQPVCYRPIYELYGLVQEELFVVLKRRLLVYVINLATCYARLRPLLMMSRVDLRASRLMEFCFPCIELEGRLCLSLSA